MDICAEAKALIETAIPGSEVSVTGGGGHFEIHVISEAFAGKRPMPRQRMVYLAIKDLMAGDHAPMHAVDRMVCETPST
jgi:acid stress-induced BolA-like protein IbaG/YrbA